MMEDRILIWRFKRGSQDALRRIYEKYRLDLLKLAISLAGNVYTAEDVVQDVFVSFAQTGERIQPAGDLRKYLVTCVANRIRNRRRDQGRHETPGLDEAAERIVCAAKRPEQWAILNEELRSLSEAMAQVPYEQREVIALYMEGDRMKQQRFVMENFDWNAQLDESFFEPNIPADYTPGEDPRAAQARQEDTKPLPLTEQERAAQPRIEETVTLFLRACSERNWEETLKYAPDLAGLPAETREAINTHMGGLTIIEVGKPFKTDDSGVWRVPCQIKWRGRGTGGKEFRVRYDETLARFVVCGGI